MDKIKEFLKKIGKGILKFIIKFKVSVIVTIIVEAVLFMGVLSEDLNNQQIGTVISKIPLFFIFILVGSLIGEGIKNFTKPDNVYTSSLLDTLKTKLFWMFGPQLIGAILGMLIAVSMSS